TCSLLMSSSKTRSPAFAMCPAIWAPIVPAPRTATLRIILLSEYRGSVYRASTPLVDFFCALSEVPSGGSHLLFLLQTAIEEDEHAYMDFHCDRNHSGSRG